MARAKAIEDRELLKLIDEFINEELGGYVKEFTYRELTEFLQENGYPGIKAHILRHNAVARTYINQLKEEEREAPVKLAAYTPLDINKMLQSCGTYDSLKRALVERDAYYRSVVRSANKALRAKSGFEERIEELERDLENKTREFERVTKRKDELIKENKELKKENAALKDLVEKSVYPEIAETILAEDHIVRPPKEPAVKDTGIIRPTDSVDIEGAFLKLLKND